MNVNLSSTKDRHHQARCQKYKHEIGTYVTVGSYDGNVIPVFFLATESCKQCPDDP